MRPIGCAETSVIKYKSTLRNILEERRILCLSMVMIMMMMMTRILLVNDNDYSDAFRIGIAVMFEY